MSFIAVLGLAALGSVGAMAGAALIAAAPSHWRERLLPPLLAYSAGSMLAAAFLGMLPQAYRALPPLIAGATVLAGLGLMLAIERFSHWHHCHAADCDERQQRGRLIVYGDAFHNFVDGVVIAAAFLTSPAVGVAATLAVIAHEVPQEMGDYAVLVTSGLGRWQALGWNLLSALTTLPGALLGYYLLTEAKAIIPYALAISAASFLYIAFGDLLPRVHEAAKKNTRSRTIQYAMLLLGMATIAMIRLNHA
jgi:zinc and cadmium transporter